MAFSYDATDQLQGEVSNEATPLVSLGHRYDLMGNRTLWGDDKAKVKIESTYNALNQLTQSKNYDTTKAATPALLTTTDYGYDLFERTCIIVKIKGTPILASPFDFL